jgi:hypothetical protein
MGKWGIVGDWGLGIGDWGLGPIPNPQSPIPNPQSPIPNNYLNALFIYIILTILLLYILIFKLNFNNKKI